MQYIIKIPRQRDVLWNQFDSSRRSSYRFESRFEIILSNYDLKLSWIGIRPFPLPLPPRIPEGYTKKLSQPLINEHSTRVSLALVTHYTVAPFSFSLLDSVHPPFSSSRVHVLRYRAHSAASIHRVHLPFLFPGHGEKHNSAVLKHLDNTG